VALFNQGRAGLIGRVADLAAEVLGGSYVIEVDASGVDVVGALNGVDGITSVTPLQGNIHRADCTRDARADIARRIVEAGGALTNMSMDRSSLDEVYVRYFEKVAHAA
jgi:ABC-2 type transport system ATP-binding protein